MCQPPVSRSDVTPRPIWFARASAAPGESAVMVTVSLRPEALRVPVM
jgi:hypothetical protein